MIAGPRVREEIATVRQPTVIHRAVDHTRELYCRKCKEHQKWSGKRAIDKEDRTTFPSPSVMFSSQRLLKGHAGKCPFGNCACARCRGVMSQRAKAIIRRYRNNSTDCQLVLKPVRFRNGNTRLRVYPTRVEEIDGKAISILPQMKPKKDDKSGDESPNSASIVDGSSGRSDEAIIEDRSEVKNNMDSTKARHMLADTVTTIRHSDGYDIPPVGNLSTLPQQSLNNSWMGSVLLAQLLCYPSLTPLLHTSSIYGTQPSVTPPWDTPISCTSTGSSETSLPSDCPIDHLKPITDPKFAIDNGPIVIDPPKAPLLSGERITRNLFLSLDADRSHPMFWPFILTVQKLEETMLCAA